MGAKLSVEPTASRQLECTPLNIMTYRVIRSREELLKKLESEEQKGTLYDYAKKCQATRNNTSYSMSQVVSKPSSNVFKKFINTKKKIQIKPNLKQSQQNTSDAERSNHRISIVHTKKEEKPKSKMIFDRCSSLPGEVFANIIVYVMNDFRNALSVSPLWYNCTIEAFTVYFNQYENRFIEKYSPHLIFHDSYLSSTKIYFAKKSGYRVDRVICFEPQQSLVNKFVTIGYTYSFYGEENKTKRSASFKFEVIPVGKPKIIWVHKNNIEACDEQSYSIPTPQINVNDMGEITLNFSNFIGVVNMSTLEWTKMLVHHIPSYNALNYNKDILLKYQPHIYEKIVADLSRICEAEDAEIDWGDSDYIDKELREKLFDVSQFKDLFIVQKVLCSGADILVSKHFLIANKEGFLKSKVLGIPVRILNENTGCRVEVKMFGLLIDRAITIELRKGDVLVFYYSSDGIAKCIM